METSTGRRTYQALPTSNRQPPPNRIPQSPTAAPITRPPAHVLATFQARNGGEAALPEAGGHNSEAWILHRWSVKFVAVSWHLRGDVAATFQIKYLGRLFAGQVGRIVCVRSMY